jgi:hypothetical protein
MPWRQFSGKSALVVKLRQQPRVHLGVWYVIVNRDTSAHAFTNFTDFTKSSSRRRALRSIACLSREKTPVTSVDTRAEVRMVTVRFISEDIPEVGIPNHRGKP